MYLYLLGINGVSKTELTVASARELKHANEANVLDTKKFSAHTVQDGIAFSASQECKRLLEIDGTTGAKSDKKYQKRESNRTEE